MSAAVNQDFVTFAGDDSYPIFTVRNSAGTPIDISSVTEIQWFSKRFFADAVATVALTMTAGQIELVDSGHGGRFQVKVGKALTAAMQGYYVHGAVLTDQTGLITTVEVGRLMVGTKPAWTYDPSSIASQPIFQVRRLLGDVIADDPQMWDTEISWALDLRHGDVYGAAAECCRSIASQYARKINVTSPGEIRTEYSDQYKHYLEMATAYEQRSKRTGAGIMPFAGGISRSNKQTYSLNTDRVQPSFNIAMTDNLYLPVGQLGNEVPNSPPGPSRT